jgi:protein involved in polysaccharide export with SLBB domain
MFTFKKNSTFLSQYPHIVLIGIVCLWSGLAWSQADTSQPSTSSASQLLQAPLPGDLTKDNRIFSPSRIFAKPAGAGVGYDLKDRPAPKPTPMHLSTTIETKVENKTTNHIGGGGIGFGGPPEAVAPNFAPSALKFSYELSDLVQSSVGSTLPIFGTELFDGRSLQSALDPLTVPADYRVGPGDELLIRAWGQIDIDFQGQIDRSGLIFLPKIGQIMVAGQKISDLKSLLNSHIAKQFKSFELTVTLGSLRQIQFYVSGFAKKPGIHTTESTATTLHGLLASGGPLPAGDFRRIELRRGDKVVAVVDAYKLLIDGDKTSDPPLLPGDVIFIPAAKGFVAVAGSVRRPAMYHLRDTTMISDVLKFAGGLSLTQQKPTIRLERLKPGGRQVENIDLSQAGADKPLQDGDILMVLPASPRFDQFITVRGNVSQPLRQPWTSGLRVSDILNPKDGLIRPAAWMQQNGRANLMGLSDLSRDTDFRRDFPDMEWDYAAIERIDPVSLSASVIPFNLAKALSKNAENDLQLMSGDTIVVFSKIDFKQPQEKKLKLVKVEGEVKAPGIYSVGLGETLSQVINRAGGLTTQAYIFGTIFSRESAKRDEAVRLKDATDRIEQDYFRYLASRSRNATTQEEGVVSTGEIESIKSLVGRLRTVQPEGRIPLNLSSSAAQYRDLPSILLEDLDSVVIPTKPATVTVVGSVFRQGSLLWNSTWTSQDYLNNSGGLRQHADSSGVVIFRADGTVRQQGGWLNGASSEINPGDTIVVPEDVQSSSWTRIFRDWSQIFYQLGLGGAAIKILRSTL